MLHGPNVTSATLDALRATLQRTRATACKVVTGWPPASPAEVLSLDVSVLVRTVTGDPAVTGVAAPDPANAVKELTPWYAAGAHWFELGNEPNAQTVQTPGDDAIWAWRYSLEQTIAACRRAFPAAKLIVGGMQTDEAGVFRRWLEISADVIATANGLAIHAYEYVSFNGGRPATAQLDQALAAARQYCPGVPVHLTEYGIHSSAVPSAAKGQRYAALVKALPAQSAFYYHCCQQPADDNQHAYALDAAGETSYGATMSALSQLAIVDMSDEIARLPKTPGYSVLPPRTNEQYITFHYSGVAYSDRSPPVERQRVLDEAAYQLRTNYGSAEQPAYPDGLLYDFVVLSDGTIVRARAQRQQLWHCGNPIGNSMSWSVHVMLGPGQDMTTAQRQSVFTLFDALRTDGAIPRSRVVCHCDWPWRLQAGPYPASSYRRQSNQSECPREILYQHVVEYRAMNDSVPTLPGARPGMTYPSTAAIAAFYTGSGGLVVFGYPTGAVYQDADRDGEVCSFQSFENVVIKEKHSLPAPWNVRPILLSEAIERAARH
jgi:hypothetical protein